jgi:hypothetical protein
MENEERDVRKPPARSLTTVSAKKESTRWKSIAVSSPISACAGKVEATRAGDFGMATDKVLQSQWTSKDRMCAKEVGKHSRQRMTMEDGAT